MGTLKIDDYKEDIARLIQKRNLIPDEFWVRIKDYRCIWFIDGQKPSVEACYNFDEERFGVTRDGKIIWGFDSGCSCPSPWDEDPEYTVKEYKEFVVGEMPELDPKWNDKTADTLGENLRDYLKLIDSVEGSLDPTEVFSIRNQEIRRFIMKRIGYKTIKKNAAVAVLHKDGDSELLSVIIKGEREKYVKVKDSSTEREYLLYVPENITRCKQGIAWTFGLSEDEYNPIKET